jgi:hypothetical protein
LALAGEGGGCTPPPLITFTITSKVAVYAPAEWADTLTLFHCFISRKMCTLWSPPATKAGGTHSPGGEGDGGVNILEDERNRIALLQ